MKKRKCYSGFYNDLLSDMNEALRWARGEVVLRTTTRTLAEVPPATITLEPDVASVFPDAASVNEALRFLIKITRENTAMVGTK